MKNKIILTTAALLFMASSGMFAATLYVGTLGSASGDYYTEIQAAVNAASVGDLILVSNGIYNTGGDVEAGSYLTNRVFCNIAIEIRSVDGPDTTIILGAPDPDTGGHGPAAVRGACLPMNAGATISGFTFSNGYTGISGDSNREQGGGGARIRHMNLITNCVIIGNFAYGRGGGLNLQVGTAADCMIINNVALNNTGGGVFAQGANMYDCIVKNNTGPYGGGIYGYDTLKIYNTIVSGNSAVHATQGKGGGILLLRTGDVQDCTIFDNTAQIWGGGIATEWGVPTIRRCTVYNNTTIEHNGGGIYLYRGGAVHDSLVYGNNSGSHGGGIFIDRGGSVYSSTFAQNTAVGNGGGGYIYTSGKTINCIFYDNTAAGSVNLGSSPDCTNWYSCADPLPAIAVSEGSIATNPVFVNAAAHDFRLLSTSPCINAGTNAFASSTDLNGDSRIEGGTIDMGCYEFVPEPGLIGFLSLLSLAFLRKK